jgi:hypothetical protein
VAWSNTFFFTNCKIYTYKNKIECQRKYMWTNTWQIRYNGGVDDNKMFALKLWKFSGYSTLLIKLETWICYVWDIYELIMVQPNAIGWNH